MTNTHRFNYAFSACPREFTNYQDLWDRDKMECTPIRCQGPDTTDPRECVMVDVLFADGHIATAFIDELERA